MGKNQHKRAASVASVPAVVAPILPVPVSTETAEAQAPAVPEEQAPTTTPVEAQAPAAPVKVQLYTIVAPKRPLTGTHFGKQGNEATHAALASAAKENGGKLTWDQILQVCKDMAHRSFATYAVKRLKVIVPVQADAA